MRKKIQDLAKGKFEYRKPDVVLPYSEIKFKVLENDIYRGEILIKCGNRIPVSGTMVSDNGCIRIPTQQFEGLEVSIPFEYQNLSMKEGMSDRGAFILTTNGGEYEVSFTVSASRFYYQTSIGAIRTLNDFTNLAKLNWKEALQVFSARHFLNIFHAGEEKWRLLHEGLCRNGFSSHEMEEFLIGTGKKQRSTFVLKEQERRFEFVKKPISDMLNIKKSEWGYLELHVSCDADFVYLDTHKLSMEEFCGKHAYISYRILPKYMHAGKNTAVVTVSSTFETYQCTIIAYKNGRREVDVEEVHKEKYEQCKLMEEYMGFSLGTSRKETWIRNSLKYLDEYNERHPDNNWYLLYRVQLMIAADLKEEASLILEQVKSECKDKHSGLWAYILYLSALINPDPDYVKEQTMKIRELFFRDQDQSVIFWMLLYLDENLSKNKKRKYNTLRTYMEKGHYSPAFFIEAYRLLEHDPEIAENPGPFEYQLFYWAAKRRILSVSLAQLIIREAEKKTIFESKFYYLLVRCNKILKTDAAVRGICVYLIKNQKIGPAYFNWFQKGVNANLRIAGLYEAYLMSWRQSDGELPLPVLQYFELNTSLPASQKAILYSYVVRNRERLAQEWDFYMKSVIHFAEEELQKGHISEDLTTLYKVYKNHVLPDQYDAVKGDIESYYKISCPVEKFTNVAVLQRGNHLGQLVNLNGKKAYVRLFLDPYVIIFEDINGHRYVSDGLCRVKQMIPGRELIHLYETLDAADQVATQEVIKLPLEEQLNASRCTIQEMEDLIEQAYKRGINTVTYEEQLLTRMLFTEEMSKNHIEIFNRVCRHSDNTAIKRAFISWYSWKYLYEDQMIPEDVIKYIYECLSSKYPLNEFCELAWLKYEAGKHYLSEDEIDKIENFLEKYLDRNLFLDFYRSFPKQIQRKFQIYDVEAFHYMTKPGSAIVFRYEVEDTLHTYRAQEAMQEPVPGIYVFHTKLFADESLHGEIVDMTNADSVICKKIVAKYSGLDKKNNSRYNRLNQAILDITNTTGSIQFTSLEEYAKLDDLSEKLFQKI